MKALNTFCLAGALLIALTISADAGADGPGSMPDSLISDEDLEVTHAGSEHWFIYQPPETGILLITLHGHSMYMSIDYFEGLSVINPENPMGTFHESLSSHVTLLEVVEGQTYHFRFYCQSSAQLESSFFILTKLLPGERTRRSFFD